MATQQLHETEAVVQPDGTVRVEGLPFASGERVRVIVVGGPPDRPRRHTAAEVDESRRILESMRGMITRYDDPFEPAVPPSDWNALRDDPR